MTQPVQHSSNRKALSVLIVQTGGADETLRSLMALRAVKHLYPELKLHVLAGPSRSVPFQRVDWIDSVMEVPVIQAGEVPVAQVARWIDQVIGRQFDLLVNWTEPGAASRMAAILSALIPAAVKIGDHLSEDQVVHSTDAWSMYRNAWAHSNVEQDIHAIDLITTQLLTALQIHAGDPNPEGGSVSVTSKYFFEARNPEFPKGWIDRPRGLKWIAVNASNAPERSAEWIEMVLRRHPDYGIVILGEGMDVDPAARVIHLNEALPFDPLVSILNQCSWLFSGAHPLVDLASLLNLRILYAAPAEAREFGLKWTETGPYGNGHVTLVSREEWSPESAYAAWSYFQAEWFHKNTLTLHGHFEHLGLLNQLNDLQIHRSRIRPAEEGGGVSYELCAGPVLEFEHWIYRVRGQMARSWFCGWLPAVDQEAAKLSLTPQLVRRIRTLQESLTLVQKLAQEGHETARKLESAARNSRSGYLMSVEDRGQIEECGKKLLELEDLIARVTKVEPELECLLQWYRQLMHNLRSPTIDGMAKETALAFDLVMEGLDLIEAYTRKTLDLARPKAVIDPVTKSQPRDLDS